MTQELNVLLAEDDADDRSFFVQGLKLLGLSHHVRLAGNHLELFDQLEKDPAVDLVVLDISMPGKDGKQCLREMKANEKFRHIPVIIMSISKNSDDIDEAFSLGAHYFAIKAYSHRSYIETLQRLFAIDWKMQPTVPPLEEFIVNLAYV